MQEPDNIRKANIILETFFGPSFSQIPPPASETAVQNSSQGQQNLLVSIQAFNNVINSGAANISLDRILIALESSNGLQGLAAAITDAITQVVRCFKDDNVIHVAGKVDPLSDIEVINTELALADMETVEKALARAVKSTV